ncbi:MAG: orotate phosphoribosyltransferase [Candidatus Omnitrophica bacterium]|nr:orotate phosphoribosyltransferase [Candidatus Omnitrophota bacterium]MBD3269615.1 orotate phosphoribosyltransferase [Candidatus Omnitrophota bacterium]
MKQRLFELLRREAFFKKRIKLSSGKYSNYYIDVRRVSLSPEGVYLISHLIFKIAKKYKVNAVGGPTLGADPIVSGVCFVAHKRKYPLRGFLIRKSPKKHGSQRLIEGQQLKRGESVILIDDVATSGGSLIKAIEVMRKNKIKTAAAITVVDREEGAAENLQKFRCPLVSLFTKSDFFKS